MEYNWMVRSLGFNKQRQSVVYSVIHNGERIATLDLSETMKLLYQDGYDDETWGEFNQEGDTPYSACTIGELREQHKRIHGVYP